MDAVLDVQKNRYIGVDVGGTRLKLRVMSGRGAVSEVENIPTPPTRDELYDVIASFVAASAQTMKLLRAYAAHGRASSVPTLCSVACACRSSVGRDVAIMLA